jgi:hypothetical protein
MGVALEYAREKAPPDVAGSLDWLARAGFAVVHERGGPGEPFGDVLVIFERPGLAVRVTRDRGQWAIDLAPGQREFNPLHILLTAWEGGAPVIRGSEPGGPIPEVHPPGVQWCGVLPGLISWLESADRAREIGEARAAWRAAVMRHLEGRGRRR